MSQANAEALRRGLEAYDRRDVEALLEECHPDVEWQSALVSGLGGETTVYRGHQGVRDLFEEVDRIVANGWMRARGRVSGAAIETPVSFIADFEGGKATRFRSFLDRRDALEAVGLAD